MNEKSITDEMIQKARECSSAEEIIALAKANDMELSMEEAKDLLQKLAPPVNGPLSDDELENAAGGGGCGTKSHYCHNCSTKMNLSTDAGGGACWRCPNCGHIDYAYFTQA